MIVRIGLILKSLRCCVIIFIFGNYLPPRYFCQTRLLSRLFLIYFFHYALHILTTFSVSIQETSKNISSTTTKPALFYLKTGGGK